MVKISIKILMVKMFIISSAKMWADVFLMQNKKSFKYALTKISAATEPCGTPEIMSLKSLLKL